MGGGGNNSVVTALRRASCRSPRGHAEWTWSQEGERESRLMQHARAAACSSLDRVLPVRYQQN